MPFYPGKFNFLQKKEKLYEGFRKISEIPVLNLQSTLTEIPL